MKATEYDKLSKQLHFVGVHTNDNCFYPGFFTKRKATGISPKENAIFIQAVLHKRLVDFKFLPRGKINIKGNYTSYYSNELVDIPTDAETVSENESALPPRTSESTETRSRKNLPNRVKFRFATQEGYDLNLEVVFACGLWYSTDSVEYFFSGVYNIHDQFKAAFCLTWEGYFVPGATDEAEKFMPLAQYDEDGKYVKPVGTDNLQGDQKLVAGRFRSIPKFPSALELKKQSNWCCIRDGCIRANDPDCITVLSDSTFNEKYNLNVFVGGELGPKNRYYFFGKYAVDESFTPGKDQNYKLSVWLVYFSGLHKSHRMKFNELCFVVISCQPAFQLNWTKFMIFGASSKRKLVQRSSSFGQVIN